MVPLGISIDGFKTELFSRVPYSGQAKNLPHDLGRVQPAPEFDSVLRIRLGQAECSTQLYEQIIKFARALIEPLNKALYKMHCGDNLLCFPSIPLKHSLVFPSIP